MSPRKALRRARARRLAASLAFSCLLACGAALLPRVSHGSGASQAAEDRAPRDERATYARPKTDAAAAESVPGEILVRFRAGAAVARKGAASGELALRVGGVETAVRVERFDPTESVEGLRLARVAPEETAAAIEALRARADVLYAEPNYRRYATSAPNDTRYPELWGLSNTGQSGGTAGADIRAEAAWNTTTGSRDAVVAVIDEGIDVSHPDLSPNVWRNPGEIPGNGIDDDGDGYVDDVNGYDFYHNDASVYDGPGTNPDGSVIDMHGTHVAGTIGAAGNNGQGVAGVNWQASLMSLKFLGPDGGSSADAIRAYGYARMMRARWLSSGGSQGANVRVTNNSYGGGGYSQAEADAIRAMGDVGILFVAAAGNESDNNDSMPSYPATYDLPNVVSVASLTRNNQLSSFSNTGARTVHLAAPGSSILSTTPGNTYTYLSGTSMATPHVAGAAALVLAAHPDFSVARLRAALLFGAEPQSFLAGKTATGARLSAAGALTNAAEIDTVAPNAPADLRVGSQDGRDVTLAWTAPGDDGTTGLASLYEIRFADAATGAQFLLAVQRPDAAGTPQTAFVRVPVRHQSGQLLVRTFDNAGNVSETAVGVSVSDPAAYDPYSVTEDAAAPLSTGGTKMNMSADDQIASSVGLNFQFPFYGTYYSRVNVSTNGTLYFGNTPPNDPFSMGKALDGRTMIAGLWDDLDLSTCERADADIYIVRPDANRVIFRWQGSRFAGSPCAPSAQPVNFEIELRSDGTIQMRYGDNPRVAPVVGLGGGEPEGYLVASHTSENAPTSLTNAPQITFTPRSRPAVANVGVLRVVFVPEAAMAGENLTVRVFANNLGPDASRGSTISVPVLAGTTFVSCTVTQGSCTGPTADNNAAVANVGSIRPGSVPADQIPAFDVVLKVTPTSSSQTYRATATIQSASFDPDTTNNTSGTLVVLGLLQPNPAPLTGVASVAAGDRHAVALRADGSVITWGSSSSGQLGDGSGFGSRSTPATVPDLSGVRAVAAGSEHSFALKQDGTLWAWGANQYGQLGDGTNGNQSLPVQVQNLAGVASLSASWHTLAVKSDGTLWAWGRNSEGQLGDGTNTNSPTPAQVQGLSSVVAAAAGEAFSLAVKSDGTVWAWGRNAEGQLGDGTTTARSTPAQVPGLSNVLAVAAGKDHAVALKLDGTVWAWGKNNYGQLGDGTFADHFTPAPVAGLTNVVAVSCGRYGDTLALKSDGTIWGWGYDGQGQLGIGMNAPVNFAPANLYTPNGINRPTQTVWLRDITSAAAGADFGVARRADGQVFTWGNGFSGQLGIDSQGNNFPRAANQAVVTPSQLVGTLPAPTFAPDGGTYADAQAVTVREAVADRSFLSVAGGGNFMAARLSDGTVWGWGQNTKGETGAQPTPTPVVFPTPGSSGSFAQPSQVQGAQGFVSVSAGGLHAYGLKSDGTVWGWGSNSSGGLGNGVDFDENPHTVPERIGTLTDVRAVVAGGWSAYAIKNDGTLWAWGTNLDGEVGDGTTARRSSPVQVPGLTRVVSVAAGNMFALALDADGNVWAWGDNLNGQLGDGTFTNHRSPARVAGLSNVVKIAAGENHSLAVRADGTLWSWGRNIFGQLGLGSSGDPPRATPAQVQGISDIAAIDAGMDHTVVLKTDGTVWTWGSNLNGQMGGATQGTQATTPVQVPGLSGVTAVATCFYSTAALKWDGTLWVWGSNSGGQLGDGTSQTRTAPVQMKRVAGDVTIRYTTDGREPTDSDPAIASGASVAIPQSAVLKARAWKTGWTPSDTKSATYTIGGIASTLQFSSSAYSAGEGAGNVQITVTRAGDATAAASVDYATVDDPAAVRCDDVTTKPGVAFARCDYATTVGTLTFAPGETAKTFTVPVIDDAFVEPGETVQLRLGNAAGAQLASPSTAALTVIDNDAPGQPNPITRTDQTGTAFFVRQQYLDFLSREPDAGGLAAWVGTINNCPANDLTCDRVAVSANFFRSQEFQLKGLFVFKFYKVAFGRMPLYAEIVSDMSSVTGSSTPELVARKAAWTSAFARRAEFASAFGSATNQQFVDALMSRYSLQSITTINPLSPDDSQVPRVTLTRSDLVNGLAAGTLTRGQVVRALADSNEVSAAEFNPAFVAMQYFGYLRRDPDTGGYNDWLRTINANPNDIRSMVNGFVNSTEYRLRFGQP